MSKKQKVSKVPAGATAMTAVQIEARENLRRSGASGSHDSRPRRERTRAASKRAALQGW